VKVGADSENQSAYVMTINRPDDLGDIANLGLALAEGKLLLAGLQQGIVGRGSYVDGPLLTRCLQCFDRIACVHMSGLLVRSHMSAGQDGFRDGGSRQNRDLVEGH
jgi:hypothetical protein